jgi:hypothetical protein
MLQTVRKGLLVLAVSVAVLVAFSAVRAVPVVGVSAPLLASDSSKGGVGG